MTEVRYKYETVPKKIVYLSNEIEEDIINRILNNDGLLCLEVLVTDLIEHKKYKYSMVRKLVMKEVD